MSYKNDLIKHFNTNKYKFYIIINKYCNFQSKHSSKNPYELVTKKYISTYLSISLKDIEYKTMKENTVNSIIHSKTMIKITTHLTCCTALKKVVLWIIC